MNFVVLNLNKYILVKIVDLILFNLVCLCRSISANKIKIQPIIVEGIVIIIKTTEKKITAKDIKSKARKKPQTEEAKKTETKPVAKPKGDKKPAAKRSKPSK